MALGSLAVLRIILTAKLQLRRHEVHLRRLRRPWHQLWQTNTKAPKGLRPKMWIVRSRRVFSVRSYTAGTVFIRTDRNQWAHDLGLDPSNEDVFWDLDDLANSPKKNQVTFVSVPRLFDKIQLRLTLDADSRLHPDRRIEAVPQNRCLLRLQLHCV